MPLVSRDRKFFNVPDIGLEFIPSVSVLLTIRGAESDRSWRQMDVSCRI